MSQFFQTTDKTREHTRANIARDLAAVYAELAAPKPSEKFSLARMIRAMAKEEFKSGSSYEAGVVQAAAISQGGAFDCQRATVPWGVFAAFQRDMGTTETEWLAALPRASAAETTFRRTSSRRF